MNEDIILIFKDGTLLLINFENNEINEKINYNNSRFLFYKNQKLTHNLV